MGRVCKSRGILGCGDDKDSLSGETGNHLVSFRLRGHGVAPLEAPLDVAAAVNLLLLVPSFHEKSSGLHGDLQLLWLVLVGRV